MGSTVGTAPAGLEMDRLYRKAHAQPSGLVVGLQFTCQLPDKEPFTIPSYLTAKFSDIHLKRRERGDYAGILYFSSMKENGTRQTKGQLGSEGFAVGFVNECGCRSMKRTKQWVCSWVK
ncbi:hypothetical protein WN943_021473 [Citrus x changshan-huyou]